ncbi:MAG: acyl carrier protein [Saccharofermentans sp.]|nr:acyl carrier protein [Saccharofermentans sp.]
MEELMSQLWMEELKLEAPPQADDSFFDLGGNSVTAKYICQDLKEELGFTISIADFYTSDKFSDIVAAAVKKQEESK